MNKHALDDYSQLALGKPNTSEKQLLSAIPKAHFPPHPDPSSAFLYTTTTWATSGYLYMIYWFYDDYKRGCHPANKVFQLMRNETIYLTLKVSCSELDHLALIGYMS